MKNRTIGLGYLMVAIILPWVFLMGASGLFQKYKNNIQEPFDIAIKYGLIWAVMLLGIGFIVFVLSIDIEKLKQWRGVSFKLSLMTFVFVLIIWMLRPELSPVVY